MAELPHELSFFRCCYRRGSFLQTRYKAAASRLDARDARREARALQSQCDRLEARLSTLESAAASALDVAHDAARQGELAALTTAAKSAVDRLHGGSRSGVVSGGNEDTAEEGGHRQSPLATPPRQASLLRSPPLLSSPSGSGQASPAVAITSMMAPVFVAPAGLSPLVSPMSSKSTWPRPLSSILRKNCGRYTEDDVEVAWAEQELDDVGDYCVIHEVPGIKATAGTIANEARGEGKRELDAEDKALAGTLALSADLRNLQEMPVAQLQQQHVTSSDEACIPEWCKDGGSTSECGDMNGRSGSVGAGSLDGRDELPVEGTNGSGTATNEDIINGQIKTMGETQPTSAPDPISEPMATDLCPPPQSVVLTEAAAAPAFAAIMSELKALRATLAHNSNPSTLAATPIRLTEPQQHLTRLNSSPASSRAQSIPSLESSVVAAGPAMQQIQMPTLPLVAATTVSKALYTGHQSPSSDHRRAKSPTVSHLGEPLPVDNAKCGDAEHKVVVAAPSEHSISAPAPPTPSISVDRKKKHGCAHSPSNTADNESLPPSPEVIDIAQCLRAEALAANSVSSALPDIAKALDLAAPHTPIASDLLSTAPKPVVRHTGPIQLVANASQPAASPASILTQDALVFPESLPRIQVEAAVATRSPAALESRSIEASAHQGALRGENAPSPRAAEAALHLAAADLASQRIAALQARQREILAKLKEGATTEAPVPAKVTPGHLKDGMLLENVRRGASAQMRNSPGAFSEASLPVQRTSSSHSFPPPPASGGNGGRNGAAASSYFDSPGYCDGPSLRSSDSSFFSRSRSGSGSSFSGSDSCDVGGSGSSRSSDDGCEGASVFERVPHRALFPLSSSSQMGHNNAASDMAAEAALAAVADWQRRSSSRSRNRSGL